MLMVLQAPRTIDDDLADDELEFSDDEKVGPASSRNVLSARSSMHSHNVPGA